ncbi:MAG: class I SAM-dependent methyltransferase [Anaeromyxobacter sp.]|nr:class I SAM-dependent methyltransferase [Anaeromyxobacter sp.]
MSKNWLSNIKRIALGRPTWSPDREYSYYGVSSEMVAQHQARQRAEADASFPRGARMVRALLGRSADEVPGTAVLDLGAGEAFIAQALSKVFGAREVIAFDAVPKQMWAAAYWCQDPAVRFVIGDAASLPFEDASFDAVVCHLFLHHVEPLSPVFREIARVLRPGGTFFAMEPTPVVGLLHHADLSENEAPIPLGRVSQECLAAGLTQPKSDYWWDRFHTTALGVFSPSYRVRTSKPGEAGPAVVRMRRTLHPMPLRGLLLDSGCQFEAMALAQAENIRAVLPPAAHGEPRQGGA